MTNQIKTDFDKVIKYLKPPKENINLRKKSLNKFINLGFPQKKEEDWKFFDLNQIISSNIKDLKFFDKELFDKKNKIFDCNFTKPATGIFPEYFKKQKDVVRTKDPMFSCLVYGKNRNFFLNYLVIPNNSIYSSVQQLI